MIDLRHIENYRENNRIEAKKALGGLPHSMWETYSSFANTLGGILLLGVEEYPDKSLHPIDLPDPQRLVREFWDIVNDPERVSVNILTEQNVTVEEIDGKRIIVLRIPRAQRYDKPVYLDGNPFHTYRRTGEGDYHCSKEEVQSMLRDAAIQSADMAVLEEVGEEALNLKTVQRYRRQMKACRPGHVWLDLDDQGFLYHIGALGRGEDHCFHPTAGGLLMFGQEYEIVKAFPHYFLDYRRQETKTGKFAARISSASGDWSGNLYDFYRRVVPEVTRTVRATEYRPIQKALQEAVINCLIHADYHGPGGVVILQNPQEIRFSNPGAFRIALETAKAGGISDPRNTALMRMFGLIDMAGRTGSGIPGIYSIWKQHHWQEPVITEGFSPARITLSLGLHGDENPSHPRRMQREKNRRLIIDYLTDHITATTLELSTFLDLSETQTRRYLKELMSDNIVVPTGNGKGRKYKLKA